MKSTKKTVLESAAKAVLIYI